MKKVNGVICYNCGKGVYKETSISDDWHGIVHCSNCNHEAPTYLLDTFEVAKIYAEKVAKLEEKKAKLKADFEKQLQSLNTEIEYNKKVAHYHEFLNGETEEVYDEDGHRRI